MAIEEVEQRVTAWLRLESSFTSVLRGCIERRATLAPELQSGIDEALSELERIQAGT